MTDAREGRLDVAVTGHTAVLTIHNPAKRNAMTPDMWRALPPLLDRLAADADVRVVVLTGHDGTFCAGADIGSLNATGTGGGDLAVAAETALAAFGKPTIAAIRGFCVGGGCQLAAACDLRLAAGDARFGVTPAKIGIVYPASATTRLVRLVGPAATKYLIYSADLIGAEHALRIGLIDELAPPEELIGRAMSFATTLASRSRLTLQASKEIIDAIAADGLDPELATAWRDAAYAGPDAAEGIAAFAERRTPDFTWHSGTT